MIIQIIGTIDLETGVIVNFYKHIGRCLNCNVENKYDVILQTIQRLFEDINGVKL